MIQTTRGDIRDMAHNGSDKYEGLQNSQKQLKPEQYGWKMPADVANKMAEMSLSPTTADSGQTSLHETSSAVEHDEETSIKSAALMRELDNAPPLSRELSFDYVRDSDSSLGQPGCSMGVWQRQAGSSLSYFPNGGMQQDISLKTVRPLEFGFKTNSSRDGLASQNPNHRDPPFGNAAVPRGAEIPDLPVMNIPPSMQEQRVKNTDIPVANAEQQPSFRTVSTVNSDLSPVNRCAETQYGLHPSQVMNSKPLSSATSSQGHLAMFTLGGNCNSSEDNFHMSFPANMGFHGMMGQAGERQMPPYYNYIGNSAAGCGRQMSHSSSTSSLRSFINDNCLVKKLSWKILCHVALTLQCKNSSASWKDLVERYGWDYERTYLFENRPHTDGIFFSLLLEPEFQDYSLEQLRADLFDLPRRDVLSDLNRMISEHNASASGGTGRQNQFP